MSYFLIAITIEYKTSVFRIVVCAKKLLMFFSEFSLYSHKFNIFA